ncbi:MAG: cytochrome c [Candidatus Sericytochromatia bacterium]|nr:cytochrome c [Candidatus Sericytochromatia bacterium]
MLVPMLLAPGIVYAVRGPTGTDATLAAEGGRVFQAKGCTGCHQMDGVGTAVACDLDRVGRRRNRGWLRVWLADPQGVRPGTLMPDPHLTHAETVALAEFLARRI